MTHNPIPTMPDAATFCTQEVLYRSFEASPAAVVSLRSFQGPMDLYCVECAKESVFRALLEPVPPFGKSLEMNTTPPALIDAEIKARFRLLLNARVMTLPFACTRDHRHIAAFIFRVGEDSICKIGQYPSLSDLQEDRIRKYRDILGDKYSELHRSIRLAANGIGVGAFAYLRRIFESVLEEAHQHALGDANWDEQTYASEHWDKKILMLRGFLPELLVQNRKVYAILSKGIHELTEEECLAYYEPVRLAIELMLDRRMEQKQKARKESAATSQLERIQQEISGDT